MSRGKGEGLKEGSGREREWGRKSCNVSNIYIGLQDALCVLNGKLIKKSIKLF